ncbi:MAG: hypothetical protein IJ504_00940 [Bacteroidales bacterium]|nr:hypothetical protein [Bacteroidales bacterium]
MRHRYITNGTAQGSKQINCYRLISKNKYSNSFIRVNIPDDLVLNTCKGDGYNTTEDTRTLEELGYDCFILVNGKWRKANFLKKHQPHEWYRVLEKYGLRSTLNGYLSKERYQTYDWSEKQAPLPSFSKDLIGPELVIISGKIQNV